MSLTSTGRLTADLRRFMDGSYDECRSCGKGLPREVASFAGYGVGGEPLYVGACCEHLISELATHIYWWWEADKRPDTTTPLWRYMDFAKFVSMLTDRGIHFARADLLGDAFEGASGIAARREEWDDHYINSFRNAIRTAPRGNVPMPSGEQIEVEARRLLAEFHAANQHDLGSTYVSCWHANTGESEALWRLYCTPNAPGVAVRADVSSLSTSWGDHPNIKLGKVYYLDFKTQFAGTYDRIFCKRKSLSHEAEVRAVISRYNDGSSPGLLVSCDLQLLVKDVVISPFSPPWFEPVLAATIKAFGMDLPISKSELLAEPFV